MRGFRFFKITASSPEPPINFFEAREIELKYAKYMYLGGNSTKYNGSTITQNNESAGVLPDLVGDRPLIYRGIDMPTVSGKPPVQVSNYFISFENQPDTYYNSDTYSTLVPVLEHWFVFADWPGQQYEGRTPRDLNLFYSANFGNSDRIIQELGGLPTASYAQPYRLNLGRMRVNADRTADYWLNGVFAGRWNFSLEFLTKDIIKQYNGLGVNTNVADFWFGQMIVIDKGLTDAEALELQSDIYTRWASVGFNIGANVSGVLLNDISWSYNSEDGLLTPSFTIINNSGKTLAPVTEWKYIWHYKNYQTNYTTQAIVGITRQLPYTAYPANDSTHTEGNVKVRIMPKFTDGTFTETYHSGVFKLIP